MEKNELHKFEEAYRANLAHFSGGLESSIIAAAATVLEFLQKEQKGNADASGKPSVTRAVRFIKLMSGLGIENMANIRGAKVSEEGKILIKMNDGRMADTGITTANEDADALIKWIERVRLYGNAVLKG